jgi:Bacterial SH3 domain
MEHRMRMRCFGVHCAAVCAVTAVMLISCQGEGERSGKAGELPGLYGIVTIDNAALRLDPLIYSARITLLRKGEKVEVLDQSKEKGWIGNNSEFWYKVRQKKGISGWIYGSNLRLFSPGRSSSMESYVTALQEQEEEELKKGLAGKWWSVDKRGDFTSHCIELFEDGTYRSYVRGGREIEGDYTLNFTEKEVLFLGGSTIGQTVHYVRRGTLYSLEKTEGGREWRFKKISESEEQPAEEPPPGITGEDGKSGPVEHDANQ